MSHPLVAQLRFARSEFQRALVGLTDEEARRRFLPMNCISWNVGHLACQEQGIWLGLAQGKILLPALDERFGFGVPSTTPALDEVWDAWRTITQAADPWLESITSETLQAYALDDGQPTKYTFGSLLLRNIYHYWYHTGENLAIRQMLGHTGLPDFVGNLDDEAPYRPE